MNPVRQFGGFDLHEKIGTGGMATVYRGVQRSLERQVVLKILHPHLSEDEHLIIRFEREARAAANLRHENIVQVIDCGRQDSTSYIAMEFVEGMDLKRLMDTYGPPPIEMATLILRDICRGLEHAHHHRIIHRDMKPANLMLTPDGMIKIMDFGLARSGEDSVGMTATGAVLGTPAYMSPEQAMGEHVDERSDVFSVGVVGYEMLGGRRPFPGDSYASVLNAIITMTPDRLERVNPAVPPEIAAVIHRMLEKNVALRYPSITAVREDLETIVERMGLVRGKDLLRRYAGSPARVTETLNGVRGPGGTLAASRPGAELLTRADFKVQETVILTPAGANGGGSSSAPASASRAAPRAGDSSAEMTVAESAASLPPAGPPAVPVAVREDSAVRTELAAARGRLSSRSRPSRGIILGLGSGAVVMAALVIVVLKVAGPHAIADDKGTQNTVDAPIDRGEIVNPPAGATGREDATTGSRVGDATPPDEGTGLLPPRPATTPGGLHPPNVPTREELKQIQERVRKSTEEALAKTAGSKNVPAGPGRKYLINSKPSFALIYLDGASTPINADGKPAARTLTAGAHTLRAVNKDLVPPIDMTFRYDVSPDDPSNTLILNLAVNAVESRKNPTLPF